MFNIRKQDTQEESIHILSCKPNYSHKYKIAKKRDRILLKVPSLYLYKKLYIYMGNFFFFFLLEKKVSQSGVVSSPLSSLYTTIYKCHGPLLSIMETKEVDLRAG